MHQFRAYVTGVFIFFFILILAQFSFSINHSVWYRGIRFRYAIALMERVKLNKSRSDDLTQSIFHCSSVVKNIPNVKLRLVSFYYPPRASYYEAAQCISGSEILWAFHHTVMMIQGRSSFYYSVITVELTDYPSFRIWIWKWIRVFIFIFGLIFVQCS